MVSLGLLIKMDLCILDKQIRWEKMDGESNFMIYIPRLLWVILKMEEDMDIVWIYQQIINQIFVDGGQTINLKEKKYGTKQNILNQNSGILTHNIL